MRASVKQFCEWAREHPKANVAAKVITGPDECYVAHRGIGGFRGRFSFNVGTLLQRDPQDCEEATVVTISNTKNSKHIMLGENDVIVDWDDIDV